MVGFADIHGKDTSAAANIENNLVLENVLVLDDSVHVRPRAHFIFLYFNHQTSACMSF